MGEYYFYCNRCNKDGSFDSVDRDCGKCCGTGKDWHEEKGFLERWKDKTKTQGNRRFIVTDLGEEKEFFYEESPPNYNLFGDRIYGNNEIDELREENKDTICNVSDLQVVYEQLSEEDIKFLQELAEMKGTSLENEIQKYGGKFIEKNKLKKNKKQSYSSGGFEAQKSRLKAKMLKLSEDSDIGGYFTFESFEVGYNKRYLSNIVAKAKVSLPRIEEKYKSSDILDVEQMYKDDDIKVVLEMKQILAHEMFHLYQTISSHPLEKYSEWSRTRMAQQWFAISQQLRNGKKYKRGDDLLDPIKNSQIKSAINIGEGNLETLFLSEEVEYCKGNYGEFHNLIFNNYEEDLSIYYLIECSATVFHLLVSRDFDCKILPEIENVEEYNLAFKKFIELSECQNITDKPALKIIFLLVAHLTTLCFEHDADEIIPMFTKISRKAKDYLSYLQIDNNKKLQGSELFKAQQQPFFTPEKPKRNLLDEAFSQWSGNPDTEQKELPNYKYKKHSIDVQSFFNECKDKDSYSEYTKLCNLIDKIIDDIKSINNEFFYQCNVDDHKLEAIASYMEDKFPSFREVYFVALLVTNEPALSRYISLFHEIGEIEHKSIYNNKIIPNKVDNWMIEQIQNLEYILEDVPVKCCAKHGDIQDKRVILSCTEKDSINNNFDFYGYKLSDVIEL